MLATDFEPSKLRSCGRLLHYVLRADVSLKQTAAVEVTVDKFSITRGRCFPYRSFQKFGIALRSVGDISSNRIPHDRTFCQPFQIRQGQQRHP